MQPNIVENFISKETALYLNDFFRSRAYPNPHGLLTYPLCADDSGKITFPNNPQGTNIYLDLTKFIVNGISQEFEVPKNKVFLDRCNYQVLIEGQEIGYHSDNRGAYQDKMKNEGWSALLYLNDQYEGGEILFYEFNENKEEIFQAYRPKPGTLIYFKGDDQHCHSVNKMISGERPNLILFFDVSP